MEPTVNRLVCLPDADAVLAEGRKIFAEIERESGKLIKGAEARAHLKFMFKATLTNGHVLDRAPTGTAKTLLCRVYAKTIGGTFRWIDLLPDLLPSDIGGRMVYNPKTRVFEVRHGPLYGANVVLANEINRAPPKTQAALLGPMGEHHLTIEGKIYRLEPIFIVLGTRNPLEHEGVYALPEAQLDRFVGQLVIKDVSEETMMEIVSIPDSWRPIEELIEEIATVTNPVELLTIREAVFKTVQVSRSLDKYLVLLRAAIMKDERVKWLSPRGPMHLKKMAIATAFLAGRDYVVIEDAQSLAVDVLAHRIVLEDQFAEEKEISGAKIVNEVLGRVSFR